MKTLVPPAPIASAKGDEKQNSFRAASKEGSLFDASFLARTYRSMVIFGTLFCVLAAFALRSVPGTLSFVAGLGLAALLLRVQEKLVGGLLRPTSETGGFDAKLLLVLLLPLKFILIGVLLWAASALGWLHLAPFAVGFFAGQMIVMGRFLGWLLTRASAKK